MSITVSKTYTDSAVLTEAQLDAIKDSIETYVNSTKFGTSDFQVAGVTAGKLDSGAIVTAGISDASISLAKLSDDVALSLIPTGTILMYGAQSNAPSGWLLMRGQDVSRNTYPNLYGVIGTLGGPSSGTNFRIPDMRFMAVRGVDEGAGVDPNAATRSSDYQLIGGTAMQTGASGDAALSYQKFALQGHKHNNNKNILTSTTGADTLPFPSFQNSTTQQFASSTVSNELGTHTEGMVTVGDFPVADIATNFTAIPNVIVEFIIKT